MFSEQRAARYDRSRILGKHDGRMITAEDQAEAERTKGLLEITEAGIEELEALKPEPVDAG